VLTGGNGANGGRGFFIEPTVIATLLLDDLAPLFRAGDVPFPQAFDTPVASRKICQAIQAENGGFIISSPKPYGPYASLDEFCSLLHTTTA
jgi:hypothetical protein